MDVRFVILSPASQQKSVPVRLPILVGRGAEAKFRIQQDSVSRRHCEFFAGEDGVYVRDLGSTNGTRLGAEEIAADVATPVPPQAVVRIGGIAFRVEYESAAKPEAAVAGDDTVPLPGSPDPRESPSGEAEAAGIPAPEEPPAGGFSWVNDGEPAPAPVADDNLDDFFKSLT